MKEIICPKAFIRIKYLYYYYILCLVPISVTKLGLNLQYSPKQE